MNDREKNITAGLIHACRLVIATAESGKETGHSPEETVISNWDVLGPKMWQAMEFMEEME